MSSKSSMDSIIQQTMTNATSLSDAILARQDLNSTKQAEELIANINSLVKSLRAVEVQKSVSETQKETLSKTIDSMEPEISALIVYNSKMSALSGPMNTDKKVPTKESDAMVNSLKAVQNDLYTLDAVLEGGEPPETGSLQKAILAEFKALPKLTSTKITLKNVSR